MSDDGHLHQHHISGQDIRAFMAPVPCMDDDGEMTLQFEPDPTQLWWVDLETTGLDPRAEGSRILEVGIMCSTAACERIGLIHGYVGPAPTDEEVATWPEVVQRMHTDNGLVADMQHSDLSLAEEADDFFSGFIAAHKLADSATVTLAGSSVHFDWDWLKVHLPKTAAMFNYRLADISAVRTFMERWAPFYAGAADSLNPMKQHRVIPDIEDSIVLAKFTRMVIMNGVSTLMPQGYAVLVPMEEEDD